MGCGITRMVNGTSLINAKVKNKSSMETELRKILAGIYRGQKENNEEAVERILLLLDVVGQSEQLFCSCRSRKVKTTGGSQCTNNRCNL